MPFGIVLPRRRRRPRRRLHRDDQPRSSSTTTTAATTSSSAAPSRFRVLDRFEADDWPAAQVELIDRPASRRAGRRARRRASRLRRAARGGRRRARARPDRPTTPSRSPPRSRCPAAQKQALLEATTRRERLVASRAPCGLAIAGLERTREIAERAKTNGHGQAGSARGSAEPSARRVRPRPPRRRGAGRPARERAVRRRGRPRGRRRRRGSARASGDLVAARREALERLGVDPGLALHDPVLEVDPGRLDRGRDVEPLAESRTSTCVIAERIRLEPPLPSPSSSRPSRSTTVGLIIEGSRRPALGEWKPSGLRSVSPSMLLTWIPVPSTKSPEPVPFEQVTLAQPPSASTAVMWVVEPRRSARNLRHARKPVLVEAGEELAGPRPPAPAASPRRA